MLAVLLITTFCSLAVILAIRFQRKHDEWLTTEARVIAHRMRRSIDVESNTVDRVVTYTFTIAGTPFVTEDMVSTRRVPEDEAAFQARHSPGQTVKVHYFPADPTQSTLTRRTFTKDDLIVILTAAGLAEMVLLAAYFTWKRST